MAVYFHGNFGLNRERMASMLKLALENPELKDKELADPFGYGAPYAQRYRQWLYRSGLTSLRLPLQLTPKGEVVYQHDPNLQSLATQWFIHWELVSDPTRAETWYFFWYEFLPAHGRFTRDELQMALMEKLGREHSAEHFGPNSTMLPGITRLILDCYTTASGLGSLELIAYDNSNYKRTSSPLLDPWNSPSHLELAYS